MRITRVGVFGDWHSNLHYVRRLLNRIIRSGGEIPDVFIHLGDFNFFPDLHGQRFLDGVNKLLEELDRDLYAIEGNHEDFNYINEFPLNEDGFGVVRSRIFYIPRGKSWVWGGKRLLGLGGAHSIDYALRTEGVDWFPEEDITDEDVSRALENPPIDYIFTHESPVSVPSPFQIDDIRTIVATQENREAIRTVVKELSPKVLFHGHHHRLHIDKFRDTLSVGLDKDGAPFSSNYVLLDLVSGEVWFQFDKKGRVSI